MTHPNAKHARYVPLSATEQDVLKRMIENQDLYVEVVGWGFHPTPIITSGDKRLQIRFPLEFTKPEGLSVPITSFHLKLRMRDGRVVASTVESTVVNGQPLYITAGMYVDLIWDLALERISEEAQRLILPGIQGKKVMSILNGQTVREDG